MNRIEAMRAAVLAGLLAGATVFVDPEARAAAAPAVGAPAPAAPDPAAPASKPAATTYHEARLRRLAFNRRTLSEAYKAVGKHDPRWDDKAVEFLDHMAEQFAGVWLPEFYKPVGLYGHKEALPEVAALVALGCDDPLVLYCHGAMLMDQFKNAEALPLLQKAGAGMRRLGYPPGRVAMVSDRLARLSADRAEAEALAVRARTDFAAACSGPDAVAGRQALLDTVWSQVDDNRARQLAFVAALAARPDADPWILGVASGRLHIKLAWDHRGGGWGNTVTDKGWKGFYAELALARDAFASAWKADPMLPEAPAEMIRVCMGAGGELNERAEDWFERAVAAQVDFNGPYLEMLNGPLQPRWGGSREAMLELGEACLAYKRYDTVVPWQYVYAVKTVGVEADRPWELLKDPAVYDKVAAVCEGYLRTPRSGRQDTFQRASRAAVAWRAGRWDESRKALDALTAGGYRPGPGAFRWFGADDGRVRMAEVYARTGPQAAAVTAADAEADPAKAAAKLRAAAATLPADDPAARYFAVRSAQRDADAKFAAGDWSPLIADGTLVGWSPFQGTWDTGDPGRLVSTPMTPVWSQLRWTDPDSTRPLGTAFEVAGRVEFHPGARPSDQSGGIVLSDPRGGATLFLGFQPFRHSVVFTSALMPPREYPAEIGKSATFRVRVANRTATFWADDKQVGEPCPLPPGVPDEPLLAIGGFGGFPVQFADVRVRKLAGGDAGDDGKAK